MAEYYFNLPQITELTIDQQAALKEINAISLSGGPGTGKSVVSLWRHISNHQRGRNSQLLTYTTTLAKYLEMCSTSQNTKAGQTVNSSLRWMNSPCSFQEIIVDEAQDLPNNYYTRLKNYSNIISYGADDAQILYPENSCTQKDLHNIFPSNKKHQLSKNFRSTQRIMLFARLAFPEAYIPMSTINGLSNNPGVLPVLMVSGGNNFEISNQKQDNAIYDIINEFKADAHNIAILVPWKKQVKYFYDLIKNKFESSRYYEDKIDFPSGCNSISNIHVTTFKSSKGLEFDTVIIPNFHKMLDNTPSEFHLEWQDYYVAVTRARSNLYLISNNNLSFLNSVSTKNIL